MLAPPRHKLPVMQETSSLRPLPLARLHRRLGGRLAPFEGVLAPADYGDVVREHAALREGCGLVDRSWIGRLELLGADRARFLEGKVTCEVKNLAPGEGTYGFVTSAQGRILADAVILALEDRFRLELPAGTGEGVAEHFGRYVLADRVEMMPAQDLLPLALVGPRSEELLGALARLPDEGPWRHVRTAVLGTEVTLVRQDRLGAPAFTLWVSASVAAPLAEGLIERGAAPAGTRALEALRVEAGLPRFGADFGPENFPQETGIDEAVSYTKGCYLGQEVVARIHYRGAVQRRLVGLRFAGEEPPPRGTALLHDGREAGAVGTALRSPALGAVAGLAVLHQRAAEPGTVVEVAGGGSAEVTALPFV